MIGGGVGRGGADGGLVVLLVIPERASFSALSRRGRDRQRSGRRFGLRFRGRQFRAQLSAPETVAGHRAIRGKARVNTCLGIK